MSKGTGTNRKVQTRVKRKDKEATTIWGKKLRDRQKGESGTNIRDYEDTSVLEKQQNWIVLLSYSKSYCIWNRDDTWTNKTSETTLLPFLGLGSFSLGLGFFLQKRKKAFRDSGSSFKKSAFRWVLHLFRHNQGLPCLLHYQAYYTHMCTMTNHLTDELTRTLSTQQRTAADWMWDTKALNANKARPAAFVITMWHCSLICKSFTFFPPYFKETTYSEV